MEMGGWGGKNGGWGFNEREREVAAMDDDFGHDALWLLEYAVFVFLTGLCLRYEHKLK